MPALRKHNRSERAEEAFMTPLPTCACCPFDWAERACRKAGGKGPKNCPTLLGKDLAAEAGRLLADDPALLEFARASCIQESEGYGNRELGYARVRPLKPRIVEVVEFARKLGVTRLGLAFCVGLRKEAAVVHEIFATNGFTVVSVICKAGRTPKDTIGLTPEQQVDPACDRETMCHPVLQALVLNRHRTGLNVLLGLCVGHDSLLLRHSDAMCTVLAVKDRLLGHNPLVPVYEYDSYYRYLKHPID